MTPSDMAILHAGTGLSAAALAGLLARGRAARCVLFAAYLGSVAASSLAISLVLGEVRWPAWLLAEALEAALAVGVALELAGRMLARLPAASAAARHAMLAVLGLTCAAAVTALARAAPSLRGAGSAEVLAYEAASSVLPMLTYGAAFLFTALLAVANWHVLPLDPLHRAILVGFSVYLVLFSAVLVSARSEEVRAVLSAANSAAYLTLLGAWAWAAWRREPPPPAPETLVRRLWPWR